MGKKENGAFQVGSPTEVINKFIRGVCVCVSHSQGCVRHSSEVHLSFTHTLLSALNTDCISFPQRWQFVSSSLIIFRSVTKDTRNHQTVSMQSLAALEFQCCFDMFIILYATDLTNRTYVFSFIKTQLFVKKILCIIQIFLFDFKNKASLLVSMKNL